MIATNGMSYILEGWMMLQNPGLSVRQRDKASKLIARGEWMCEFERAALRLQALNELRERVRPLMSRVMVIEFLTHRQRLTLSGIVRSLFFGYSSTDEAFERALVSTTLGSVDGSGRVVGYSNLHASDIVKIRFDFERYTFRLQSADGQLRVHSFTWR